MCCSETRSAIATYFQTDLAVVEVRPGESQEDAWCRYLANHPGSAGVHVKIFHYPEPITLKKKKGSSPILPSRTMENLQ